jgi:pimeloyl-ACP methyl ester carboxylesterase
LGVQNDNLPAGNRGEKKQMATYLLVHGGGHGGWCYKKVAKFLRAAGHEVYTPTLTGLGERSHLVGPHIDLDLQINDVVQILQYEDLSDVILAGHSYGGMVITGVADRAPERIQRLVYLDAAHPYNGQSLCDNAPEPMAFTKSGLRVVNGVDLVLWPDAISPEFFGISDPADVAWTAARLTPHPWKCFTQKLILRDEAAVRRIPRTNINCSESLARSSDEARQRQRDGEHAWEIDTGHDLMITEPVKVADMLLKLA